MKIIFYGSRGSTHVKNKLHKKIVGTIVVCKGVKIYIDCGFNKKIDANSIIIITKAIYIKHICDDIPYSQIYTTKSIANELELKNVNKFTCGVPIKLMDVDIFPIRTIYKLGHETIGIQIGNVFIAHWIKKIPNFKYWLPHIKYYIGNGSRWKTICRQIKYIPKGIRCYFTNCGSDIIRDHKNYVRLLDNPTIHKIVHDGLVLDTNSL